MNHNEQQLLNITYNKTREHDAAIADLLARVVTLEEELKKEKHSNGRT